MSDVYISHEATWVCSKCTEYVGALDFCPKCVLKDRDRLRARNEVLEKFRHRVAYEPIGHAEATADEILQQITDEARALENTNADKTP